MELLKRILKESIAQKAMRMQLQASHAPSIVTAKGPSVLANMPVVTAADVQQLYTLLFPNELEAIKEKKACKGSMNIVGVGQILLIAEPGASLISIKFYFPEGHSMFDSAWESVENIPTPAQVAAPIATIAAMPQADAQEDQSAMQAAVGMGSSAVQLAPLTPKLASMSIPVTQDSMASAAPVLIPVAGLGGGLAPASNEEISKQVAPVPLDPPTSIPQNIFATPPPVTTASLKSLQNNKIPSDKIGLAFVPPVGPLPSVTPEQEQEPAAPTPMEPKLAPPALNLVQPTSPVVQPIKPLQNLPPAENTVEDVEIPFGDDPRKSAPVGKGAVIDEVLRDMVKHKASDLHLTIGQPVCMRIDGEIERVGTELITAEKLKTWLMPIMPPASRLEFAKDSDTDFAYEVPGVARFRVNIFRDRNGVGSVMRQIPSKVLTADQLNLSEAIRRFCTLTKGLVLVTGPTGSGKSTTLAAMVDLINKTRKDHILTIEDPIEFVHEQQQCLVNQREVHRHTNSYSRALRAALREDPDIVLIGEMRDLETVEIAIETAETGHLVFGTLHTNTAISTVDRIVDQFPTEQQAQIRVMMAESLKGVVSQTLLKKIGGGRVSAQEVLVVNKAMAALIREGKTHMIANQMQSNKAEGNVLLNEALMDHVINKRVALMDAFVKAVDKDNFVSLAQQKGLDVKELPVAKK